MNKLDEKEDQKLKRGICPKCDSENFYHLAWGGGARNIVCENGHKFWFAPPFVSEYIGQELENK